MPLRAMRTAIPPTATRAARVLPGRIGGIDDLDATDALELLGKAPAPASAARLTRGQIAAALRNARRRDIETKTARIQTALRGEQLGRTAVITTAYARILLAEDSEEAAAGLQITGALFPFWSFRGTYGEARSWIGRVLNHSARQPVPDRVKVLCVGCVMAAMQGDLQDAAAMLEQGRVEAEQALSPTALVHISFGDGVLALYRGELTAAFEAYARAAEGFSSNRAGSFYVAALTLLGWIRESAGDTQQAIAYHRQVLAIAEACGELLFRSGALRDLGVGVWREGERSKAIELVEDALRVNQRMEAR
ncbi:MAG: tetratricopeptide repeat-containing protein [Hyphomicrobiales bacterium]|nr:MAG: tetratricopeptide repeat-containing protein [Hyphomicrobiales bacterium]